MSKADLGKSERFYLFRHDGDTFEWYHGSLNFGDKARHFLAPTKEELITAVAASAAGNWTYVIGAVEVTVLGQRNLEVIPHG